MDNKVSSRGGTSHIISPSHLKVKEDRHLAKHHSHGSKLYLRVHPSDRASVRHKY